MKNIDFLNGLSITDVSTAAGFFFVVFDGNRSLQCCLEVSEQGDSNHTFLNKISSQYNGFSEGLSWDCNSWASDEGGEIGHINTFLMNQAVKYGITVE